MNPIFPIRESHVGRRESERGMTLIELIVAMSIGSILITLIFQFFNTQSQSFLQSRDTAEMQQELRWALQFISDHLKLAGNGVPSISIDDTGQKIIENVNGAGAKQDSLNVIGSFRSLVITLDQKMTSLGADIQCSDKGNVPPKALSDLLEAGDLVVISDGTSTEVFMITKVQGNLLSHKTAAPWNASDNLVLMYNTGSTLVLAAQYSFFVATDASGRPNLMTKTQSYPAQVLADDLDLFQIRFKMKSGSYQDVIDVSEIEDIRQIDITLRARSHNPIRGYRDPVYHDAYKRLQLKTTVIPKNLVKNI